jgi:aspartate aminotransferase-like enzyme
MNLFTPGPVNLSEPAMQALTGPDVHHRSTFFRQVMADLGQHMKIAFQTDNDVITLTSSGTGAMEAAVANLFSPGDTVLVPVSGKFSHRWVEICEAYGINLCCIDLAPGRSPMPSAIADELRAREDVGAVLLTHCETSTGSLTDLKSISAAVHDLERERGRPILVCADCITSLCIDELRKDEWRVDCTIAASQKGLLSPPGLAFLSLSEEAIKRVMISGSPRYYLDLRRYLDEPLECPFTPAVSLVRAVEASLRSILEMGLENVWQANRSAASALRLLLEAAGLRPVAEHQAGAVVAFWVDDLDAETICRALENEHGIVIARGQLDLKDRILRISPIGKGPREIRRFAKAFAEALAEVGRTLELSDVEDRLEQMLEGCAIWE